jgi:chaperonin GroES
LRERSDFSLQLWEDVHEIQTFARPRADPRVEQEAKTTGGIIIPDTAQEKPMEGDVIAVGPGARGEDGKVHPLDVKTGDRVLFGKWSGTEIKIDGEDLMIMKESDVMGIVAAGAVTIKTS